MPLLDRLRTSTFRPAWTYTPRGILWLFRFTGAGRIVGEVRDPSAKTAEYFCLDEATGATLWAGLTLGDPWWSGIEDVGPYRAYFHGFRKPDMPQHLGITAVDVETGATLWSAAEAVFLFATDDDVYTVRQGFEAMRFSVLDARTGAFRRDLGTDPAPVNALRAARNAVDAFDGYAYPAPFDAAHPDRDRFGAVVEALLPADRVRGVPEVLVAPPHLFLSWHEDGEPGTGARPALRQMFLAHDVERRKTLRREVMNDGLAAPAPDSFLVKDGRLFYVRDARILTAYSLEPRTAS